MKTTEVRWFFPGEIPDEVHDWFNALGRPEIQPARTDRYLSPTGHGLGVKLREDRLEVKFRWGRGSSQIFAPGVAGMVENWVKSGFRFPGKFSGWIPVQKERQILFYQVTSEGEVLPSTPGVIPRQGGGVELTRVWLDEDPWWTVGIEVYGPAGKRKNVLTSIARQVFSGSPPQLQLDGSYSYARLLHKRYTQRR